MKPQPMIKETARENVLIKGRALAASKYGKAIIQFAKESANNSYKHTDKEKDNIYQSAYQQGYNDGLKKLLNDFILGLEKSELAYQKRISQSKKSLEKQLMELFNDARIKEIIAHYFIGQLEDPSGIHLYLPVDMQQNFKNHLSDIKICPNTQSDAIALEVNNEICYFSPLIAAKNTLPQIYSVSTRCQILEKHKIAYQQLITLINNTWDGDSNNHE